MFDTCDDEKDEEKPIVAKSAVDLQRLKLMKLMKNPEKPILLPEKPKTKNTPTIPEFVRNVMGSSAGAGSGEFHVYRHLRRKEYSRQKFIQEKGQKELLDEEYHKKLEENKRKAEEATIKRRAKRLKKKQKMKQSRKMKPNVKANENKNVQNDSSEIDDNSCSENDDKIQNNERMSDVSEDVVSEAKNVKAEQTNNQTIEENLKCSKQLTQNDLNTSLHNNQNISSTEKESDNDHMD